MDWTGLEGMPSIPLGWMDLWVGWSIDHLTVLITNQLIAENGVDGVESIVKVHYNPSFDQYSKRHRLKYKHFVFRFEIASNSHLFAFLLFFHFFVVFFPCLPMFCPCFPFFATFLHFYLFWRRDHSFSSSVVTIIATITSFSSFTTTTNFSSFSEGFQNIAADSRDFVPRGFHGHIWLKISTRKYWIS